MAGQFSIAGSSRTEAHVVVAAIHEGNHVGRGESVPLARNGESVPDTIAAIEAMAPAIAGSLDRVALRAAMPPGSARNAIDCALFDLEAKQAGTSAAAMIGLPSPRPVETAFTLSLDAPEAMAKAAGAAAFRPLLKVKLGGAGDPARIAAVRAAAPGVRLIADANQAWSTQDFEENMAACVAAGVELVEQPLPVGADASLAVLPRPIPICADESIRTVDDLDALAGRYDAVNIKLDKAGGLTEALALLAEARRRGLAIMVGCMVGTSLAMAPALLLAQSVDYVDLDGPLLLARDRVPGLRYEGSIVYPPEPALWG